MPLFTVFTTAATMRPLTTDVATVNARSCHATGAA
jgi:hypothetical protein